MSEHADDLFGLPEDPALREQLLAEIHALPDETWAPMLSELLGMFEQWALRSGFPPDRAFGVACDLTLNLANTFGGDKFYLPRGDRVRRALRDAEIWRRYRGRPQDVERLAREYGLTSIRVYAILRRQRALHRARSQAGLFDRSA